MRRGQASQDARIAPCPPRGENRGRCRQERRRSAGSPSTLGFDGGGSGSSGGGAPSRRQTRASLSYSGVCQLYPVSQDWPAGPGGPVSPVSPFSPRSPCGPGTVESAPGWPAGPVGPGTVESAPDRPGSPEGPGSVESEPGRPGLPGAPDAPGDGVIVGAALPSLPSLPSVPARPGTPDGPTSPREPGSPATGVPPICCTWRASASLASFASRRSTARSCTVKRAAPARIAPPTARTSLLRDRLSSGALCRLTLSPPSRLLSGTEAGPRRR